MGNVDNCKHSIFNKLWGEWKCKSKSHVLHYPGIQCLECPEYIKDTEKKIDISEDDDV